MRAWYILKKAIAIIAILLVMYMFVGFFFWHNIVNNTQETENSKMVTEAIEPAYIFFQPSTDFYTMIAASFQDSLGSTWFNVPSKEEMQERIQDQLHGRGQEQEQDQTQEGQGQE